MNRFLILLGGICGLLISCAPSGNGGSEGERVLQTDSRVQGTSILSGLQNAWDVAFTPDGAMLFTERCRGVSVRTLDGTTRQLFGGVGALYDTGDSFCDDHTGFLGLAVHPAFKYNRTVYVFMLSQFNSKEHVVARFKVNADYTQVTDRVDIVTGLPYKAVSNAWGGSGANSGGRLRFGPDGNLYISVGDGHKATAQDASSLGGKILVVTDDGGVIRDLSKFPAEPRLYAIGLRQVLGMTFKSSEVVACDASVQGGDILKLKAGSNGGWDARAVGTTSCADSYCGDQVRTLNSSVKAVTFSEGKSISSCDILAGENWGSLNGKLLVSSSVSGNLEILDAENLSPEGQLTLPEASVRSLVAQEGELFVVTDTEIWRVIPR